MRALQRIILHRALLSALGAGLLLLGGVWWALKPRAMRFVFDPALAVAIQDALIVRFSQDPIGAHALHEEITRVFPAVNTVTVKKSPRKIATACISVDRPRLKINCDTTEYAITREGSLCLSKDFNPYYLEGLPHITVQSRQALNHMATQSVWQKLVRLDHRLFDNFDVRFFEPAHIHLVSKKYKRLVIQTDVEHLDNDKRIQAAERIYNQKKGDSLKKGLKFDIRLHDAIVCAPLEGGEL